MEKEEYFAGLDKYRPHELNWEERVYILTAEEEELIKKRYEHYRDIQLSYGSDKAMAEAWARAKIGNSHELLVKPADLEIFDREESWRKPWNKLGGAERNAFFRLFSSLANGIHFRGDGNGAAPDFRKEVIRILEDDERFIKAMVR